MYSFEGDYRSKPTQSLGGASKKEQKSALLQRTQEERRRREEQRLRITSSVKIQAFYRGCRERERVRGLARHQYDELCQLVQSGQKPLDSETSLSELLRPLLICYKADQDSSRLTWLCQQLIRDQSILGKLVAKQQTGLHQTKLLLAICCSYLQLVARTSQPLAIPMRMLEVYTSVQAYKQACGEVQAHKILHDILAFLIHNGYYKCMQVLVKEKIPSSIEHSVTAPTPLAASILDLIRKPLDAVANNLDNTTLRDASFQSLCAEFLCVPFPEQVSQFILPALAHSSTFPFVPLLRAMLPQNIEHLTNQEEEVVMETVMQVSDWMLRVEPSPWLLYATLSLSEKHLENLNRSELHCYLMVLYKLVPQLQATRQRLFDEDSDDEDDEEIAMDVDGGGCLHSLREVRAYCLRLLNKPAHVRGLIATSSRNPDPNTLTAICTVCHTLMAHNKVLIHNTRLLYSLAFNPVFLRNLWYACASVSARTVTGSQMTLLQMISRGMLMSQEDMGRIVPLLSVFCSLFSHLLLSLHDAEFYGDEEHGSRSCMPFPVPALVPMSQALRDCCLGLVELAHPESRPAIKEDYKKAFQSVGAIQNVLSGNELHGQLETFAYLFKVMTKLVKQLYARDTRRPFCPVDHWLSRQISVHAERHSQIFKSGSAFVKRPFGALSALNAHRAMEEEGPPLSTTEVRHLTVLTELPFVVPFSERIKIFQRLIHQDKVEHQGEVRHLMGGPLINIMVRRNYLYEDAFDKLSVENEPNFKLKMQVQLVNFAGLDEAGIDGGGIFREFMSELIKTAFDPNRGFFRATQDKLLYPNPQAQLLVENYTKHYYFLGRILGKAIYEQMLVEIPFARFLLLKILSRTRAGDLEIHHLQSMDPEMYRNLLSLRHYEGDVNELGLDFTVVNNDLGEAQVEELKPGGRDIVVDNHNRIEYIYLMANYRLNRQIRNHVNAFRQGLADVINLEWLRMFDHRELQTLISGAEEAIDLEDLKEHTNYSGGYNTDHVVIKSFWSAVSSFTDTQKRQLLKFVTSCSRPPLLGFKELHPAFCIHYAGNEAERLPTASTCMNLLKLPEFKDEDTLRAKLLYAIESSAGFELS